MAEIVKIVKIKTEVGDSVEQIQGVEKGFEGVEKQQKKATTATFGMTGAVKMLGLALKAAGIGLVIGALVGLSSAFMKNQKIADLFNQGLEILNLTFGSLVNTYINVVEGFLTAANAAGFFESRISNVTNIISTQLNMAMNTFNLAMQAATLLWNMSPFGDGANIEDIKNLGKEIIKFGGDQKALIEDQVENIETFIDDTELAIDIMTTVLGEQTEGLITLFTDSENNIIKVSAALVQLTNEVKLAEAEQRRLQLTNQKDAEIQRQIRDDVSKTIDARIEANTELGRILKEQGETEKANAQLAVNLAQLRFDQDEDNIDLQVALKNAKTELIDIEERIIGQQSEQRVNETSLQDERIANAQELSAIGKTALEESLNAIDIEEQKRKQLAERTISDEEELEATLLNIKNDAAQKKKKINDDVKLASDKAKVDELKLTMATEKAKRDIVANTMGSISKLIGENTAAGKALAVGQTLINTYSAAAAALAPPPIGAGPIFGPIAAAGAIASGLANVKSIIATELPGAEGETGATGGNPSVPQVNTQFGSGGIGGLIPNMGSITAPDTQPVQAYVVETDISDAQALQEELDIQATL